MSVLFKEIVFGPIHSRRFGRSLGINVLPLDSKVCNFNCIYCECGWTNLKDEKPGYFSFEEIAGAVNQAFAQLSQQQVGIDSITFAGNGEPTMHPDFDRILDEVIRCRDFYFPSVKVVVLTNAALLGKSRVKSALLKADLCVLKLDAGTDRMLQLIDQPLGRKDVQWYVDHIRDFKGKVILQTMFLRGYYNGQLIDNTTEEELSHWLEHLKAIQPASVMIYSIDRDTPAEGLQKISAQELESIADKVRRAGIPAEAYV